MKMPVTPVVEDLRLLAAPVNVAAAGARGTTVELALADELVVQTPEVDAAAVDLVEALGTEVVFEEVQSPHVSELVEVVVVTVDDVQSPQTSDVVVGATGVVVEVQSPQTSEVVVATTGVVVEVQSPQV